MSITTSNQCARYPCVYCVTTENDPFIDDTASSQSSCFEGENPSFEGSLRGKSEQKDRTGDNEGEDLHTCVFTLALTALTAFSVLRKFCVVVVAFPAPRRNAKLKFGLS